MVDLSVRFDSKLTFRDHISEKIIIKLSVLGIINQNFIYMDEHTFILLYKSMVCPHVEFANSNLCFEEKEQLHFVEENAKVNAEYYINNLLPKLVEECHDLLGDDFIFQQDGQPAHGAKTTQEWLGHHCPNFIDKDSWPPNSPDLNPLDYHVWGAMLEEYNKLNPKPQTTAELKVALQVIWNNMSDETIRKCVASLRNRLNGVH